MITNEKINSIQRKIKQLITEVEKEEQVKITFGSCRYSDVDYKSTMTVKSIAKDTQTKKANKSQDTMLSKSYGFSGNIIGKTFVSGFKTFKITEFKTRNRKFPIIASCLGKSYKFQVSRVKMIMDIEKAKKKK